ncbi:MAG: TIGR00153 family protein [bacterium]|nr:TIGR00153 family protein [bacterium]
MIFKKSSKEDKVYDKIDEFLDLGRDCVVKTSETLQSYLERNDEYVDLSYSVHRIESKADDKRREIEQLLCEGAFLPLFRGDIINFLERADSILDKCESLCDYLVLYRPIFPEEMFNGLLEIFDHTLKAYSFLVEAYHKLMEDMSKVVEISLKIEREEGKIDKLEWQLQKQLFDSKNLQLAEKILIRDFITFLADISDLIEDSSDKIDVIRMTRNL